MCSSSSTRTARSTTNTAHFPGVNGLYSDGKNPRSPADTPGFTQTYVDANTGETVTVQPFRVGPEQNSTFKDSTDHSHAGLAAKIDVENGVPKMDKFAFVEWQRYARSGSAQGEAMGKQFARLVMAHIDCDTIPFFWRYASRFTIFDNIFATEDTPSTPNAIAMIAGQSGETQWVKHPGATSKPTEDGFTGTISGTINGKTYSGTATTQGPPVVNDPQPWWGSEFDDTAANREPTSPKEDWRPSNIASNLTFASLPLTFMGGWINWFMDQDRNPAFDLADIQKDIAFLSQLGGEPVQWRWYQNGYDHEPSDAGGAATHENYVSHHNGPQYFGYLANNSAEQTNLRGEGDFFADMMKNALPRTGGVFYIRGGYYNLNYPKQTAIIQNPNYPNKNGLTAAEIAAINVAKSGDDDHPAYSDSQLSEAMAARAINAIAANKDIWEHSAIIITYDESDGLYDHVPPRILSYGPDGLPLARGIRIPLLLISPYARVARGLARRGRSQRGHRDDQCAVRPAGALESPGRSRRARRRRFASVQRLCAGGLRAEILGSARHELGRDRQSALGLRQGAGERRAAAAARLLRDDPGRRRRDVPALRRQRLRGDRGHAGRRAARHPERNPGGIQFAAVHPAGL